MKKKSSLFVKKLFLSLSVVAGLSISPMVLVSTAQANFLTNTIDAIRGHIDDVENRINHDDEYINGDSINANQFRTDDIGRDSIHWANGTASIIRVDDEFYLQLQSDFKSGPAPDLYVYLAGSQVIDESSFWAANPVELAKLKSGSGAQFYKLDSYDEEAHFEVIIWCKRFGAFIGAVTL